MTEKANLGEGEIWFQHFEQKHTYEQKYEQSTLDKAYKRSKYGPLKRRMQANRSHVWKGHTAHLLNKDLNCPKYAKRTNKYGQVKKTMHEHNANNQQRRATPSSEPCSLSQKNRQREMISFVQGLRKSENTANWSAKVQEASFWSYISGFRIRKKKLML